MIKINVLCIEDNAKKYKAIQTKLTEKVATDELALELIFTCAESYEVAIKYIEEKHFDIAIIDILLPYMDGQIDKRAAEVIVQKIDDGNAMSKPLMIGLTIDNNAYVSVEDFFSTRLLGLELFSFDDDQWAQNIALIIRRTIHNLASFQEYSDRVPKIDLLILTARYENEFAPIAKNMNWLERSSERDEIGGTTAIQGTLKIGEDEFETVLVCQMKMGLSSTASLTSQLVSKYRPHCLSMLGMCCGFRVPECIKPSKLLDVIITDTSNCWDEGKYSDDKEVGIGGFSYKPVVRNMSEKTADIIDSALEKNSLNFERRAAKFIKRKANVEALAELVDEYSSTPKLKKGKNVSGTCVVSSLDMVQEILQRNTTALSLEMEIYSVMNSVYLLHGFKPDVICIKGVADFGEEKEDGKYDPVQPIASVLSLIALEEILIEKLKVSALLNTYK